MRLLLIRHGETDWNRQGRFQGREDIPLNENGKLQARICGEALKNTKIGAIIASPLVRAQETAKIIAEIVGLKQIVVDQDLIERDFGKISGLSPKEREAFIKAEKDAGMEAFEAVAERMSLCMKKYANQFPDMDLLMISHGASINAYLSSISKDDIGTGKTLLKNTCINIVDYNNNDSSILHYNISPEEYSEIVG